MFETNETSEIKFSQDSVQSCAPGIAAEIDKFKAIPVNIPMVGAGHFKFTGVSINHRSIAKPNEFNFVFKFAFQLDTDQSIRTARFLNDTHHICDLMINIHFKKNPAHPAVGNIHNLATLTADLLQHLTNFNAGIAAELPRAGLLDLDCPMLEEASPGVWVVPNPATPLKRRFQLTQQGQTLTFAHSLYMPQTQEESFQPPPIVSRPYHTANNFFGALAVDDDPSDLVDIIP